MVFASALQVGKGRNNSNNKNPILNTKNNAEKSPEQRRRDKLLLKHGMKNISAGGCDDYNDDIGGLLARDNDDDDEDDNDNQYHSHHSNVSSIHMFGQLEPPTPPPPPPQRLPSIHSNSTGSSSIIFRCNHNHDRISDHKNYTILISIQRIDPLRCTQNHKIIPRSNLYG